MSAQLDLFAPAGAPVTAPSTTTGVRPPLKWAGGKTWQVPHVLRLWQPHRHRRLVEPFCGGLGMALGLIPESALLNDLNAHVINFYRWCTRGLDTSGVTMANSEPTYYANRDDFNALIKESGDSAKAAALFYYLNRTGFNGLCRFGPHGFNVPFGKHQTITYRTDFSDYATAFASWQFTSLDFERVTLDRDDFVYADPPYDVEFTTYTQDGFDWSDQVRTAEWLAGHPGPVVLSNQATDRIVKLYRRLGFALRYLSAPRRISCTGDRTPAKEVLALRNFGALGEAA